MEIENAKDVHEHLKYRGFGDALNKEVDKNMQAGLPEFTVKDTTKIGDDNVDYLLHFRKHDTENKYYFNQFDAALTTADDTVLSHTFYDNQNITKKEAFNMLKYGEKTAVYKTLFNKDGEQYHAWLNLDTAGEKDKNNNYKVNLYHDNYYQKQPFVVKDDLNNLPVPIKEIDGDKNIDTIERSLRKGNAVNVTAFHEGKEMPALLLVNAKAGKVEVYDEQLNLIQGKNREQSQDQSTAQQASQATDEVKKKSMNQQNAPVDWTKKNNNTKGLRV